jgi:Periplasmic glucans biosynthesis protein
MFLFGANQPSKVLNYRRELHDSSGLSIHAGNGEWIWRPLNNPKHLSVSNFTVENPRGFGLLQRGRNFSHYEDLDDNYDKRPSAWIEPEGDWGKGSVDLVEIPTADETNDNIVAFWSPAELPEVGKPLEVGYRLHWTLDDAAFHSPDSAWVKQTLRSTGDVKQSNLIRQPDGSVAYLVDFEGPSLKKLLPDAPVRSQVSVSDNAELVENSVRYNEHTKGWRLTLRMKIKDAGKPTEMRAALVQDITPPEPEHVSTQVLKADKVLAKQHEKQAKKDAKDKEAKQPEAAPATPEPIKTEQVLTETWSYQLPADE